MEDNEIIRLLFARDELGLRNITDKYGRQMQTLAEQLCGNRQDAEEVVNDSLRGVWDAIPPERPSHFAAYLMRIVRNLACRRVRRETAQKRAGTVPVDEVAEEALAAFAEAENPAEQESDSAAIGYALNRFLEQCSPRDRVIFLRRYFYADSVAQIGSALQMDRAAVSMRLTRMRGRLAEILKAEGVWL